LHRFLSCLGMLTVKRYSVARLVWQWFYWRPHKTSWSHDPSLVQKGCLLHYMSVSRAGFPVICICALLLTVLYCRKCKKLLFRTTSSSRSETLHVTWSWVSRQANEVLYSTVLLWVRATQESALFDLKILQLYCTTQGIHILRANVKVLLCHSAY